MSSKLLFEDQEFKYANYPFPNSIANDPMILYHASTSCFEEKIEQEGLKVGRVHFELEELQSIANLFYRLGWMGKPGSMTTLKPFSINHDNQRHNIKPIYLGRTSYEVVNYARYQNSGGEIAKAVRYCFQDLYEFLNNESLRNEHKSRIEKQIYQAKIEGRVHESPKQSITLKELENSLVDLEHINQRAISLIENTEYGLVYAIKFSEDNIKDMLNHNWMGIKYFKDISPNQIVAKAIVPKEYRSKHSNDYHDFKIPAEEGILKLTPTE
jgi:hypothetical protein